MINNSKEDFVSKLNMIQQSIWKIEDYCIKNLGTSEKNQAELIELKFCLNLLHKKIDNIESELRGLRIDDGE